MKGCLLFFIVLVMLGIIVEIFEAMFYLLILGGYVVGALAIWYVAKLLYKKINEL